MTRLLATGEPDGLSRTVTLLLLVVAAFVVVGAIIIAFYLGYLSTFGR